MVYYCTVEHVNFLAYRKYLANAAPAHLRLAFSGFDMYTSPQGAAGALSYHDPLEGTETSN